MARKRLNDTASVVGMPIDGQGERHITIKQVPNGYSVREAKYDGNGGYSAQERFTESEPCVYTAEELGKSRSSNSGLRDATRYLKGK